MYIVPVVLVSVLLNIPRWFELELQKIQIPLQQEQQQQQQPNSSHSNSNSNSSSGSSFFPGSSESENNNFTSVVVVGGTWLRYNQHYVTYYLHWTLLLSTGIFPLAALAFLNTRIYLRIKEVQKVRTAAQSR